MEFDKSKPIQLLELAGVEYVLVRKEKYDELLDKLEALDTALDITRSKSEASQDLLQAMLKGDFTIQQIQEVTKTRSLGGRLKLVRQMRKMDQRKLAEKTGVSQTTISNLENNRISDPSYKSLDALAEALGVPEAAVHPFLDSVKSAR